MTDSLKERLRSRIDPRIVQPDELAREALARIEELEGENKRLEQGRYQRDQRLIEQKATIAKLEGENKILVTAREDRNDIIEQCQETILSDLSPDGGKK